MRLNYKKIYYDMLKEKQPEKLYDLKILDLLDNLNMVEDVLKANSLVSDSSRKNIK